MYFTIQAVNGFKCFEGMISEKKSTFGSIEAPLLEFEHQFELAYNQQTDHS